MKKILRIVCMVMLLLCGCSFMKGSEVEVQPEQTAAPAATLAPEDYVIPDFTEEEILHMTDEEILAYGELIKQHRLVSVEMPNYLIEEFGLDTYQVGEETRHYRDIGSPARKSADNYEEACMIVRNELKNRDDYTDLNDYLSRDNVRGLYYDDMRLLGENKELWIFSLEEYENQAYTGRVTEIVYKSSYYDEENHMTYFELSEESVRHFFLSRARRLPGNEYCIGEYVNYNEEDGGYYYNQYYFAIGSFETEIEYYDITLRCRKSRIMAEGLVERWYEEEDIRCVYFPGGRG